MTKERYYIDEDELTIRDRDVFHHGDGPIFQDDSICKCENKGRAIEICNALNTLSTQSGSEEAYSNMMEETWDAMEEQSNDR